MATQTSQQETAVLSTGALMAAAGNTYERPGSHCRTRDFSQPLSSQTSTNATGLITPPVAMAVDNFQGAPRGATSRCRPRAARDRWACSRGVLPYRQNTDADLARRSDADRHRRADPRPAHRRRHDQEQRIDPRGEVPGPPGLGPAGHRRRLGRPGAAVLRLVQAERLHGHRDRAPPGH